MQCRKRGEENAGRKVVELRYWFYQVAMAFLTASTARRFRTGGRDRSAFEVGPANCGAGAESELRSVSRGRLGRCFSRRAAASTVLLFFLALPRVGFAQTSTNVPSLAKRVDAGF
jgi:hypothetical protein